MTKLLAVFFALLAPAFGAYRYYYSNPLTVIDPTRWAQSPEGLLLSRIAVPDGTSDYEISTRLTLAASGGVYTHYLRASADARPLPAAAGSFYAVEFQDPRVTPAACIGTLAIYRQQNGVSTLLAMTEAPCRNGTVMRSVRTAERIEVYLDGVPIVAVADAAIPAGQPGIGVRQAPAGNAIALVELGTLDRVAPNAPDRAAIGVSAFPDFVDMQWPAATDDPAGTGILRYEVFRDGRLLARTPNRFIDAAVSGGATYEYSIVAVDYHGNRSQPASVTVTTPASAVRRPKQAGEPRAAAANAVGPGGSLDPRRAGVRALGDYWGGAGEQIDVRSGNLNFTMPLIKAMGRGGWSVSFSLSYNSQLWRQDSGGTWKIGQDVGYGFGWRLMAGSVFPYWSDPYTLDHYIFTDSTGAEYRLDVNTNGVWHSTEGIYVWYDQPANRLYFRDGSFWTMGSQSAGTEQDTGTLYPTVMQDSNGNLIQMVYKPGIGMPSNNSSARIATIEDVRGKGSFTHSFNYNNDAIPHLGSASCSIGSGEYYSFTYAAGQALNSPWGQSFGTTALLTSVTDNIPLTRTFEYAGTSGELSRVVLPHGGDLRWTYRDFTYSTNTAPRTLREVLYRYLTKAAGANPEIYTFSHDDAADALAPIHGYTALTDPDNSQKVWYWDTSTGSSTAYEARATSWGRRLLREDYTWSQDPAGNPYISASVRALDPDAAYSATSKTEQSLDAYGNVLQAKVYNYGNLSTPARTYNYTYLGTSDYLSRYILNRLVNATVTDGPKTITLVTNSYDYEVFSPMYGLYEHAGNVGVYRGNVGRRTTPGKSVVFTHDITGTVRSARDDYNHSLAIDSTATYNYAAPTQLTPGSNSNFASSYTYTSFLGIASATEPNAATSTTTYDGNARPSKTTSPHGAETTYAYGSNPSTQTATTNGRWAKTTLDGLGRVVKVERGDASGTKSVVETEYGSCACSPLGKVKRVSQPYAPSAAVYWTSYTYDGLGRTLSVTAPDAASVATYTYQGNSTTVADAAGKSKTFTTNAIGNLVKVTEPNPAGGANLETNYTYNLLDKLAQVAMPRGGYTQTRTFVYDDNGRLTSATNPENGTVTYTYKPDGSLSYKTDAKGQVVGYEYDAYQRVTGITAGAPPSSTYYAQFYYDTNPFDSTFSENAWGRRTAAVVQISDPEAGNPTFTDMYSYTPAGLVTKKRLRVQRYDYADLNAAYAYDNEGRMTSMTYPTGLSYTYAYDSLGLPASMTQSETSTDVYSAQWGAAGQLLQVQYHNGLAWMQYTENRQYNAALQLVQQTGSGVSGSTSLSLNIEYGYVAGQNNGRISRQKDWVSGEEVNYAYDSLQRLVSAVTTGPEWGLSFTYDGFGNLTQKTVTKGTGPSFSNAVDAATNRLVGYTYDANGNVMATPGWASGFTYDGLNRLSRSTVAGNMEYRGYNAESKLVWRRNTQMEVYFYGIDGKKLSTYSFYYNDALEVVLLPVSTNVYFAGQLVKSQDKWVMTDRLGSVRLNSAGERLNYYPFGEERTAATNERQKFGTYFREGSGLDYADQRYYSSTTGRFLTPDPSGPGDPSDPQSWNLYAYVQGDPINFNDPEGLDINLPITYGAYECTSRLYDETLGKAGYGKTADALTNFARSDWGRMALAMWGEVRPDTASDAAINTAMMGVGFTFINRYNMRGTIPDFGKASDSLGRVVINASDIWNNDGDMLSSAKSSLTGVLKGNSQSGDCSGLIQSIKIAGAVMAQTVGFSGGGIGALPNVFNPVGSAVYFRSSGGQPGAPYGYSTYAIKTLEWMGWQGSRRNRRKFLSFWGIAPLAAGGDPGKPDPEGPGDLIIMQ